MIHVTMNNIFQPPIASAQWVRIIYVHTIPVEILIAAYSKFLTYSIYRYLNDGQQFDIGRLLVTELFDCQLFDPLLYHYIIHYVRSKSFFPMTILSRSIVDWTRISSFYILFYFKNLIISIKMYFYIFFSTHLICCSKCDFNDVVYWV